MKNRLQKRKRERYIPSPPQRVGNTSPPPIHTPAIYLHPLVFTKEGIEMMGVL